MKSARKGRQWLRDRIWDGAGIGYFTFGVLNYVGDRRWGYAALSLTFAALCAYDLRKQLKRVTYS